MAYKGISLADDPVHYRVNITGQAPPIVDGDITWNNATQGQSDHIFISSMTSDGLDIEQISDIIVIGSSITIIDTDHVGVYQQWMIDAITKHPDYIDLQVTLADGDHNQFGEDRKVKFIASNFTEVPPALFTEGSIVKASEYMRAIMATKNPGDAMVINATKTGFDFTQTGSGIVPIDEPTPPPDLSALPDPDEVQAILDYAKQIAADLKTVGIYK